MPTSLVVETLELAAAPVVRTVESQVLSAAIVADNVSVTRSDKSGDIDDHDIDGRKR